MIPATKLRLTILFTLGISLFCGLVFSVSYLYLHASILQGVKDKILIDGVNELRDHLHNSGWDNFSKLEDDEIFQIYTNKGVFVTQSGNSFFFRQPFDPSIPLAIGDQPHIFQIVTFQNTRYMTLYFQLDPLHIARIADPIVELTKYEHNFLNMVLLSVPGIFLFAFLLGRLFVSLAMRPITEAFSFQENFSSNITHELHTPLTSLKGNLEVSLRQMRQPDEYRQFISIGLSEVNRIIHLLHDLYLLASSNVQSLTLQKESVLFSELVEDIEHSIKKQLDTKSVQLIKNWDDSLVVHCDATLFSRAIANLLDNSIKYSTQNSQIKMEATLQGNRFDLVCTNECQFQGNDRIKDLLTPFHRGSNSETPKTKGKGLGLSIIKYIILSHRGKLDLKIIDTHLFQAHLSLPQKRS